LRARNLKPGFFKNPELAELPYEARLLFAGLWCMADREGRLEDRSSKIKMELFPADSLDVEQLLDRLHNKGLIQRYQLGKARCIQVIEFLKHQHPHQKEPPSTLPKPGASTGLLLDDIQVQHQSSPGQAPDTPSAGTSATRLIPSSLIPESGSLNPDPCIPGSRATPGGTEGFGKQTKTAVPRETNPADILDGVAFFDSKLSDLWPGLPPTDADRQAAGRSIETILGEELGTEAELIANCMAFQKQQRAMGNEGTRFVMGIRKFFEPRGLNWRGPFAIPKSQQKPKAERPTYRTADEIEAEERARAAG
jgi:hypothetical protein